MTTARAVIFNGPNEPAVLREVEIPVLASGEVLVRVTMSTICGSDLHTMAGKRTTPLPTILGHEIVGIILAFGPGTPPGDVRGKVLEAGQRVTWAIGAAAQADFFTEHGMPQKAAALFKYGHERLTSRHPLSGGFATHCVLVAGTAIVIVPEPLADAVICPANCAGATAAGALRLAGSLADTTIVVQGAGMLGLSACAMAAAAGARHILAIDTRRDRLELAMHFGATHTVSADEAPQRLPQLARELTEGRGADAALEFSGNAAATESVLDSLRIGGRLILVGAVFPGPALRLDPEKIIRRLLRIEGLHNYTPDDLLTAVDFLARHADHFPFASLVTAIFPLVDHEQAVQQAQTSSVLRVALRP